MSDTPEVRCPACGEVVRLRLALRRTEAAKALGVSGDTFDEHVRPYVPVVRLGSVRTYPVEGLRAFLECEGSAPIDDVRGRAQAMIR